MPATDDGSGDLPDGFLPRGVAPDGFRPDAFAAEGARRERATVQSRGTRLILLFARLLFMALVLATPGLVVASRASETDPFNFSIVVGLTLATGSLGLVVVVIDALTPNKRLASIFGIYLGICLGLVGAYAIGSLLDAIVEAWDSRTRTPPSTSTSRRSRSD